MATATPAVPLPDYQVSGAAAHQRNGPGSSSVGLGPFFGVRAAVLLLTALSCFFGRVCAAHAEGPDEWYDCTRLTAGRRRCWWWRRWRAPRRLADEAKQLAAAPPPPA